MKTAVVTGVTGFIGKSIAKELLAQGYKVYGVGRTEEKFVDFENKDFFVKIVLDFEQYADLYKIIKEKDIDLFFHASYRGVNGTKKSDYLVQLQNLEISCTTVIQASMLGCKRYIYIGSVDEYEIAKLPDMEFCAPTHSRVYASIKYASEVIGKALAYERNMEYVAALLALTYGEGNKTNILPNIIIKNLMLDKPTDLITGDNYFDMIYIEEAIRGIMAIAEKGKNYESYYVGHEQLRTFKQIVLGINDILGGKCIMNFGKYPDPSFSIDYESIDRGKIYRDTGYKCEFVMENAILRTQKWIQL